MTDEQKPSFEQALALWMAAAQAMIDENYARAYQHVKPPRLETSEGGIKYVRIVSREQSGTSGSVYAFVERSTGDVLKADGWKRPAKGARGNIYDPARPGVGVNGANYARKGGA